MYTTEGNIKFNSDSYNNQLLIEVKSVEIITNHLLTSIIGVETLSNLTLMLNKLGKVRLMFFVLCYPGDLIS